MNLLIISQHFWPESFIINNLTEELVKKKINVQVLTGKPNYLSGNIKKKFKPFSISKVNYKGIKIFRLPIISRGNKSAFRLTLNYLSFIFSGIIFSRFLLKKKIDCIFVYATSPLLQALIGVYLKFTMKTKLIVWVQDLWPEVLIDTKYIQNKILLKTIDLLVKFIYKNSDLLLAQSDAFKKHLKKKYKLKNVITFENPGIKHHIKIKKRTKQKIILYAGNIGKAQPFYKIIKIAQKIRKQNKIIFKIVGGGSDYGWLKKEIKNHNLNKNIILENFKNQKNLKREYENADFLLILLQKGHSFSKTIPNKFQNYLSTGKPILCIGSGVINNKIIKHKVGFVFNEKKNNINTFFNGLAKLSKRNLTKYKLRNTKLFDRNYKLVYRSMCLIKILKKVLT